MCLCIDAEVLRGKNFDLMFCPKNNIRLDLIPYLTLMNPGIHHGTDTIAPLYT